MQRNAAQRITPRPQMQGAVRNLGMFTRECCARVTLKQVRRSRVRHRSAAFLRLSSLPEKTAATCSRSARSARQSRARSVGDEPCCEALATDHEDALDARRSRCGRAILGNDLEILLGAEVSENSMIIRRIPSWILGSPESARSGDNAVERQRRSTVAGVSIRSSSGTPTASVECSSSNLGSCPVHAMISTANALRRCRSPMFKRGEERAKRPRFPLRKNRAHDGANCRQTSRIDNTRRKIAPESRRNTDSEGLVVTSHEAPPHHRRAEKEEHEFIGRCRKCRVGAKPV